MKFIAAVAKFLISKTILVAIFAIAILMFFWPRVRIVLFALAVVTIGIFSPNLVQRLVVGAVNQRK